MELNFTEFFQNMGMDVNPVDGSLDGAPEMYGAMTFLKSVSPTTYKFLICYGFCKGIISNQCVTYVRNVLLTYLQF